MNCPYCSHPDSRVVDSRSADEGVRRRRQCIKCGTRFTTYERVQSTALMVVKADGRREEFNPEKLMTGLRKACAKRPLPMGTLDKVVVEIETTLQRLGRAEIPSSLIGERVMEKLKSLDRIAYIRFASVYREFADIERFKHEVDSLLEAKEGVQQPSAQLPLLMDESPGPIPKRRRGRPRQREGALISPNGNTMEKKRN